MSDGMRCDIPERERIEILRKELATLLEPYLELKANVIKTQIPTYVCYSQWFDTDYEVRYREDVKELLEKIDRDMGVVKRNFIDEARKKHKTLLPGYSFDELGYTHWIDLRDLVNFPRISGHTERIEIKEENFIKEVCYGTRKEKKV